jgi:hypothetical protein
MKKNLQLPDIPEEEQTPLVKSLLALLEQLVVRVQSLEEENQQLKDDIRVLKGEKTRPTFKPSKMDENTEKKGTPDKRTKKKKKRPGSEKQSKNVQLVIHEDTCIQPEAIPTGSRFKGYRDFIVQELEIRANNTRYRLGCWETPAGERLVGQLPNALQGRHYGPMLVSYLLHQHHHCQVTQPLLREQLREWGIVISSGEINHLLTAGKERFHAEKDHLLTTGLAVSRYITVDDSGARHQGNNGYVTQIGNPHFAWFASTGSKSRVNFLQLLRAGETGYRVNVQALAYMKQQKLPEPVLQALAESAQQTFETAWAWASHLTALGITRERHRRIATEGALVGLLVEQGLSERLVIVSDDAGQFNVLRHGLCWIHMERLIHTLLPLNEAHREDIAGVRDQVWRLYAALKAYKQKPTPAKKRALSKRFDAIFTQKTRYETLNRLLKRLYQNKAELLLVLDRPEIPLHTNDSERDIRDYVKRRKVSGGTRSDVGRRCRDTFASLKKTCRKLGISFWVYLTDRLTQTEAILPLSELLRQKAVMA